MIHRWDENSRNLYRTVRICRHCKILKISRHEFDGGKPVHWTEFWRGSEQIKSPGDKTPKCELIEVEA